MAKDSGCAGSFGERLRELRGPLTQYALARRSVIGSEALTRQRVSYIENGQLPTASQLRCYLHGCSRVDLFDELDILRQQLLKSGQETIAPTPAPAPVPGTGWLRWRLAVAGAAVVLLSAATVLVVLLFGRPLAVAECAPNFVCFWPEPDFGGQKVTLDPVWVSRNHCSVLPFEARSVMNSSRERQLGFSGQDCAGQHTVLNHLGNSERSISARSYRHS